jgi:hypothetical protein
MDYGLSQIGNAVVRRLMVGEVNVEGKSVSLGNMDDNFLPQSGNTRVQGKDDFMILLDHQ